MAAILTLVKGVAGKPSHAPLTDVSIGAYTVGVLMLIAGFAGLEQAAMAKGSLLAISGGLIVAVPTSLTGLLDWADLSKGSNARKLANYHLTVMILATLTFAGTWLLQRKGYLDGEVTTGGLIAGCAALGLLTLGGTLAYVYGVRVVKRNVSLADALIPGRLETASPASTNGATAAAPSSSGDGYGRDAQAGTAGSAAPAAAPAAVAAPAAPAPATPTATAPSALAAYEAYVVAKRGE